MNKRYPITLTVAALALLIPAASIAQNLRPEKTIFVKPRVGISWYLSDTEISPFSFEMDNWKSEDGVPYAAGLELGYQFSQSTSLSLGWQITNHPLMFSYGDEPPEGDEATETGTVLNAAQLLFRLGTTGRIAPFLALGGNVTFSQDGRSNDPGFGPSAGLGLDIVLSPRSSLVLEWLANMTFPDDAIDGRDETPRPDPNDDPVDLGPFDLISSVTLGFKYNFKSALTPVTIMDIECPSTLTVNETGTFTATINSDASQPLDNRWAFGDGATGTGLTTSHSYDQPGTYTVTFTSSNRGSTDTETCTVEVIPAPVPAGIVSLTANPQSFELCEPVTVNFSANVNGDTPITYSWDFGDGSTGSGATPSHTYTEPGTYTVTLTATNAAGTDTRTITIEALDCESICDDITDLNSVYFGQNSSTLTEEGRAALQENIEILRECPDICVRIEGFAGPGERNPQQLSEDRARAVEQFYIDNGIAASRLMAVGMGRVAGTSKKEGAAQYRRVDSIPVPCEDLGE